MASCEMTVVSLFQEEDNIEGRPVLTPGHIEGGCCLSAVSPVTHHPTTHRHSQISTGSPTEMHLPFNYAPL